MNHAHLVGPSWLNNQTGESKAAIDEFDKDIRRHTGRISNKSWTIPVYLDRARSLFETSLMTLT
jgi:hypothetical protein